MKIILFRHGEKQRIESTLLDDKLGVSLTDLGVSQINKLGDILAKKFPFLKSSQVIYSSPYKRTLQSAEIIKSILDIKEIIVFPEFSELMAYTNYQNPREFRKHLQGLAMQNIDWIPPETNASFRSLISNFLDKLKEIYQKDPTKKVLVSTHGGIIRNVVYFLDPKTKPSDDVIEESKINEGGYTVLNYNGKDFFVEAFDVHDHLKNDNI